ncbi:type 1 glutamine amidotransferase domain-containing protein [Desulfosarcina sp.]|uniref:type 1 glutamine amidotransferase domain-containing protein n=1 Tax=Desulfosarcina sp. TaxID=2027861 RepID=UPI0029BD4A60|nr:type 1 glutamine amidotransferase domain-containing protein [Desulfosarcina sp.]MDX2453288.1 type 1 glutamine amidotransferase domain-containing protein [Desulfosarcina sp.]MDX2491011.1 type 1 glutamine amidotransferase domain-containing protein [Desulfosarcina sp.]
MKILMVLTSHEKLGKTGLKTGFWLEEFASPYYVFKDRNIEVTLASPKGGNPPLDPKSDAPDFQTAATERFRNDKESQKKLANTHRLDALDPSDFDAVFYPGGHGPLWDLAEDKNSISLLETFYRQGKPMGLVCHAPGVLRHTNREDGDPLVKGKKVTGFSNTEEEAVQLTEVVPFLLEDMLKSNQGLYTKGVDWESHVEVDGNLLTGQNPASSEAVAHEMINQLRKKQG